jgi:AcrR family transcriptional regulator
VSSGAFGTKGVPRFEREQQIIAAAVGEFGARGYSGASVVAIARQTGISKPLIYQYFGSKDGLYLACLQAVGDGLLARLRAAELDVDDTVASRIHPLRAVFLALEPQPDAWRLLFDTSMPRTGEIAGAAHGYRSAINKLATQGSRRFLQVRGLRGGLDASALADIWTGVVDSAVRWWLAHPDESAQDMIARCERLLGAIAG